MDILSSLQNVQNIGSSYEYNKYSCEFRFGQNSYIQFHLFKVLFSITPLVTSLPLIFIYWKNNFKFFKQKETK